MIRKWVLPAIAIVTGLAIWFWILSPLLGFHFRSGTEAYLQQVIRDAEISDRNLDPGWDSEDVTGKVCDHVDPTILKNLDLPRFGNKTKPGSDVWSFTQDKSLFAACADHTQRYLEIAIEHETSVCSAVVSVFPTCDP